MSRPAYGSVKECTKCGIHRDYYGDFTTEYNAIGQFSGGVADEWLIRTCKECGYSWEEACLDAPTL